MGVALSSCGMFEKDLPQYPCPKVLILRDAGHLVRFKPGPGRDITDIQFEAALANFKGTCKYVKGGVNIDLQIMIGVERGAAGKSSDVDFDYFVALPDYRPSPEGKKILPVHGQFQDNLTRLTYQDEVNMFLPLKNNATGPNHEVVLGFQLTPDELKYNRSRYRR